MMLAQVPADHVCYYPDAWIGTHSAAYYASVSVTESPTTMDWERGRDLIARGARECGR
jgi:hypothetical protein